MGARHKPAKTTYNSRAEGFIPRTITIDRETDALLMEMSHGQFSAFIRCLVWREAGRREGIVLAAAKASCWPPRNPQNSILQTRISEEIFDVEREVKNG